MNPDKRDHIIKILELIAWENSLGTNDFDVVEHLYTSGHFIAYFNVFIRSYKLNNDVWFNIEISDLKDVLEEQEVYEYICNLRDLYRI